MNKRWKSLIGGIVGVVIGLMIASLIRDGQIDWRAIWYFVPFAFLLLLFYLGLNLYKKRD
ncbi:hypothetical protein [Oceanobacillus manasiensis]|uniref:hypothetical protein n=1 Tax=Oceanobacillus manasiensis TaxID=586413 RepID=UPI0005AACB6A|nr:hypothetical protein [Oceanobacillus manasiensis]